MFDDYANEQDKLDEFIECLIKENLMLKDKIQVIVDDALHILNEYTLLKKYWRM